MEKFEASKGAKFFPCCRLKPLEDQDVPLVRTSRGEARLLAINEQTADVVVESHLQVYRNRLALHEKGQERPSPPERITIPLNEIRYPVAPPPEWQVKLAWHEIQMIAAVRTAAAPLAEFARSLLACGVLFHTLFALGCWLFPGGGV